MHPASGPASSQSIHARQISLGLLASISSLASGWRDDLKSLRLSGLGSPEAIRDRDVQQWLYIHSLVLETNKSRRQVTRETSVSPEIRGRCRRTCCRHRGSHRSRRHRSQREGKGAANVVVSGFYGQFVQDFRSAAFLLAKQAITSVRAIGCSRGLTPGAVSAVRVRP